MQIHNSKIGTRDAGVTKYRRFTPTAVRVASEQTDPNAPLPITVIASTDRAVDWGNWREILSHKEGAISTKAAKSLLLNHNTDLIIGRIKEIRTIGGSLEVDAEILPSARLASGVSVIEAVRTGALSGVSIGYHYAESDCKIDRDSNTLTAEKWRLLEVTLTATPADDSAGIISRAFPGVLDEAQNKNKRTRTIMDKFLKWLKARGFTLALLTDEQFEHLRSIHTRGEEPAADYAPEAREASEDDTEEDEKPASDEARAVEAKRIRGVVARARSLGLDPENYIEMDPAKVSDAMLRDISEKTRTNKPSTPAVSGVVDSADKLLSHARASLYSVGGIKAEGEEAKAMRNVRPMGMRQMLREVARAAGYSDAPYWSDMELAVRASEFIDLRTFGRRDSANKIVANFSNLLANVANKALQSGLDEYDGATWNIWTTVRNVPNFLQVTNTNLASGRLTSTPEGEAFAELTQKDAAYNSQLGLFGATISASFQAIVNDEFGKILGDLRRAGSIAALTIDREVYRVLLNATWTNDSTASAGLSTPANIDKPRADLREKLSPAGERMGIVARYLLHDAVNANPAQVATGAIYGPGQTTAPSTGARQITPIESQWIGDTNLLGGTLTTDYFLVGNPAIHDTVLVNFLDGIGQSPIIMPFDSGAVAAEKYKIMLPFAATVATHADSAANTRVSGIQRARA